MNLLLAQSGGPTAVLNQSLIGALEAGLKSRKFSKIFGSRNGLRGLLHRDLVDLSKVSSLGRKQIRIQPGAALGTHRLPLDRNALLLCVRRMREAGIGAFAYIGGNGSMHTVQQILFTAKMVAYPLLAIGSPKTVDNDLEETDHSPGFGSAARHNALAVYHAGLDTEAVGLVDRVKVIEVMGRDTGWLAAATALARGIWEPSPFGRGKGEGTSPAPHLILLPERPLRIPAFLAAVRGFIDKQGHCLIVTSEGARDLRGKPLSASGHALDKDAAGQVQYGGAAQALARLVRDRLKVKARDEKYGTAQRVAADRVSETDAREAYGVGAEAVRLLLKAESGVMVTLIRKSGRRYACGFGMTPLEKAARKVRPLPNRFIAKSGMDVTTAFVRYAGPLASFPSP